MTKQILKTILAGILAGAALFVMPFFLIRVFVFIMIMAAIIKLLAGGRYRYGRHYAFAEKFANSTEEERAAFREKARHRCCHNQRREQKQDNNN